MKTSSKSSFFKRLLVLVLTFLIAFNLYMFRDDIFYRPNDNLEEVGTRNFKGIENLKLIGEIYEVLDDIGNYNGTGILRVRIIESNIKYYDPRDKQANYYCIIKNGKAEIYEGGLSGIKKGDIIHVDIAKGATQIYIITEEKFEKKATIIYPRRFFDFIKREGYQNI